MTTIEAKTPATGTPTFRYSYTIGNQATPPAPGFSGPVSVAVAGDGLLYVMCSYYEYQPCWKFVAKCNLDEDYLGHFGSYGSGDGQFTWPNSIAVDRAGQVYVTDEWLQRISVFDGDGAFLKKFGEQGHAPGQWDRPAGIVFDADDNLLLVDSLNHRVQKLTKDGGFISEFGGPGDGEGQFNTPWGINLDRQGNIYVADWRNDRVQKFDSEGRFLAQFGGPGDGEGELRRPSGVAVDSQGFVYIADWGHDVVQVFDPEGRYVTRFIGDCHGYSKWAKARMASDPEGMAKQRAVVTDFTIERVFFQPTTVKVDDQDRILVVDTGRHRIQIYERAD